MTLRTPNKRQSPKNTAMPINHSEQNKLNLAQLDDIAAQLDKTADNIIGHHSTPSMPTANTTEISNEQPQWVGKLLLNIETMGKNILESTNRQLQLYNTKIDDLTNEVKILQSALAKRDKKIQELEETIHIRDDMIFEQEERLDKLERDFLSDTAIVTSPGFEHVQSDEEALYHLSSISKVDITQFKNIEI